MNQVAASDTLHWSLQDVVTRLAHAQQVAALLSIGSLAENQLTPASDYDLVIVLHEFAWPWIVGVTYIEQRFTDLLFVAASAIERISALEALVAQEHELAPVIRWLRQGQLLFAHWPQVAQAQAKVQQAEWLQPLSDNGAYGAWFAINYNLAQARRMLQSTDPLYRKTVEIRLAVYGHTDVWFGYFTIRKLAWSGDKPAVQHLLTHDPEFLAVYQQLIQTTDIDQKMMLYAKVAALATAPLGGLWPPFVTVSNEQMAYDLWQRLIGGDSHLGSPA